MKKYILTLTLIFSLLLTFSCSNEPKLPQDALAPTVPTNLDNTIPEVGSPKALAMKKANSEFKQDLLSYTATNSLNLGLELSKQIATFSNDLKLDLKLIDNGFKINASTNNDSYGFTGNIEIKTENINSKDIKNSINLTFDKDGKKYIYESISYPMNDNTPEKPILRIKVIVDGKEYSLNTNDPNFDENVKAAIDEVLLKMKNLINQALASRKIIIGDGRVIIETSFDLNKQQMKAIVNFNDINIGNNNYWFKGQIEITKDTISAFATMDTNGEIGKHNFYFNFKQEYVDKKFNTLIETYIDNTRFK